VNWLNASQGFPAAYKFVNQPGDVDYDANADVDLWEPFDPGFDADNRFRNRLAYYVLPDVDEWYKAAYYDPHMLDGAGGYWNFPTGSHDPPLPVVSGTDPGTAVHSQRLSQGPADITQAGGLSPYGVMALGGNVWEWEETELDLVNDDPAAIRGVRGGRWLNAPGALNVFERDDDDYPTHEFLNLGFRVARIPVPSSLVEFDVSPGLGKFETADEVDSFLIVEASSDGYRIKAFQAGPEDGPLPRLSIHWTTEPDQWYLIEAELESVSITNDSRDSRDAVADIESADGIRFGTQVLPPNPASGVYGLAWQFNPLGDDFGDVSVEWAFTAIPIDPPIPGDADADGAVGFADFLAVSGRFNSDGWGWSGGDFNFDGTTDFADFLILSDGFGRTSGAVAAIPEPSSLTLLVLVVATIGPMWRRCRFPLELPRRRRCRNS
jgi:hypothetical protein